jgi:site-specific DNA-methyltransferase (adenine-specific)
MEFPKDFINKIVCGDCVEILKEIPDNSIDTIITDPPYNLTSITKRFGNANPEKENYAMTKSKSAYMSRGFMGQKWDGTGISFSVGLWKEVLRVAKPGATLLCFGGTRTWHRLACAIEDAGWIIKDTICWIYSQGFPKSLNIEKSLPLFDWK